MYNLSHKYPKQLCRCVCANLQCISFDLQSAYVECLLNFHKGISAVTSQLQSWGIYLHYRCWTSIPTHFLGPHLQKKHSIYFQEQYIYFSSFGKFGTPRENMRHCHQAVLCWNLTTNTRMMFNSPTRLIIGTWYPGRSNSLGIHQLLLFDR